MPGEHPSKVAKDYVDKVSYFLEGNYGFHVYSNAYEGKDAACVFVGERKIRFDLIVDQKRVEKNPPNEARYKTNFFCECKWREDPSDLKRELKLFLEKAMDASPKIRRQCDDNFGFVFISNKVFGVDQSNLEDIVYVKNLLKAKRTSKSLTDLSTRTSILCLTDWFLKTTAKGEV